MVSGDGYGEVSIPGGKQDPADKKLFHKTAFRELEQETGLYWSVLHGRRPVCVYETEIHRTYMWEVPYFEISDLQRNRKGHATFETCKWFSNDKSQHGWVPLEALLRENEWAGADGEVSKLWKLSRNSIFLGLEALKSTSCLQGKGEGKGKGKGAPIDDCKGKGKGAPIDDCKGKGKGTPIDDCKGKGKGGAHVSNHDHLIQYVLGLSLDAQVILARALISSDAVMDNL